MTDMSANPQPNTAAPAPAGLPHGHDVHGKSLGFAVENTSDTTAEKEVNHPTSGDPTTLSNSDMTDTQIQKGLPLTKQEKHSTKNLGAAFDGGARLALPSSPI